jgi:hypothetical protein
MVSAPNFTGTVDLYNGVLDESGGALGEPLAAAG